ncbi:MAG: DAK2 domain-containing protein [Chloroflexota bacterium]|nr:DAK2 domain-containing protein [Chloroflexota bacterium]
MITQARFRQSDNRVVDGYLLKRLFSAGVTWLEHNKDRVNQLNVFPVPDGDTGTNMFLTMRSAYAAIAHLDDPHVGRMMTALARGALMGSRGNSGTILSQLWQGVAEVLEGHEKLDATLLAHATRNAVDKAYKAVDKPVEGTILTVSRQMMEIVQDRYQTTPDLIALLRRMLFAGRESLRRTPDLLPILKKAGVVDSGGQGLLIIFEGMMRALCGRPVEAIYALDASAASTSWEEALAPEDELGYGYDVQFLMRGDQLDAAKVRQALTDMGGWSTLVVGGADLLKVHVHVHNPGEPLAYAISSGATLDDIVVENMQKQYETYLVHHGTHEPRVRTDIDGTAVIAVASGQGMQQICYDFGAAAVIGGGQTMNPSTGDFLEMIGKLPNQTIVLLPNNKNILLSAQQAAKEAIGKTVRVVPSITVPQGVAALCEYNNFTPEHDLSTIADAMKANLASVITCEITTATRSIDFDGIEVRAGQRIGLIDDVLVAADDDAFALAEKLLHRASAARHELVTIYYGEGVSEGEARLLVDHLSGHFPKLGYEIVNGGQALYPYIIGLE